jgi:FixJ family two-component response regulator
MREECKMDESAGRVFVVDNDASVCRGLSRLLHSAGYETESFHSATDYLEREHFDDVGCLVLDIHMPPLSGIELQLRLNEQRSDLPIIFLTGHGDLPMGIKAMRRGAEDFLTKPVDEEALLDAVQRALARHHSVRAERLESADAQARLDTLTPRELEVLRCILDGAINKKIAKDLSISEKTVKAHRAKVMAKMAASTAAELGGICASLDITSKTAPLNRPY